MQEHISFTTLDLLTFTECFTVIKLEQEMFCYFFIFYSFVIHLF